jgi:alpha-tubulin suppressor-like RCC1 family protein
MFPYLSTHRQFCLSRATLRRLLQAAAFLLVPHFAAAEPLAGAIGIQNSCAIVTGGGVTCWGYTTVANPSYPEDYIKVPTAIDGLSSGVVQLAGSGCALTSGGGVKCWGPNQYGQLGNGTTSTVPVYPAGDVVGLTSGVAAIAGGGVHNCALTIAGAVKCWGYNGDGRLGNNATSNSMVPVDVFGLGNGTTTAISSNGGHTCALTTGGGVKCWGPSSNSQLGHTATRPPGGSFEIKPVDVLGLSSGVTAIYTGRSHSCAFVTGGGIKCWGQTLFLSGDSDPVNSPSPIDMPELVATGISSMAIGFGWICVLTNAGGVKCMGDNANGALGDGTFTHRKSLADTLRLESGVTAISPMCAVKDTGMVYCWGEGSSFQLGNGDNTNRSTPVLAGNFTAQKIAFDQPILPQELRDSPLAMLATSSSGLPVSYVAGPSSVCTVSGSQLNLIGAGDCTVTALQGGDATYGEAVPVLRTFNVSDHNVIRLANISTRVWSQGLAEATPFAGFVIGASQGKKKVGIVATGPSLANYGISNPMADPVIRLYNQGNAQIAQNDNWDFGPFPQSTDANETELRKFGLGPPNRLESGLVVDLDPGAYTVRVFDSQGRDGVTLVAVYELDRYENRLINISTRGLVLTGNDVMIAGFIVDGSGPQQVAVVATGPSLTQYGITNPLADPSFTIVRQSDNTVVVENDNWQTAPNAAQLQAAGFAPSNPVEAGVLVTLPPGAYTAVVKGANGSTGISVVGVYAVP